MFKPGDRVICINNWNLSDYLCINKTYIVVRCVDTKYVDLNDGGQYSQSRFILDVKYQRKQKLEKLCSK
jgi:hypothetical protein